jgi:hypothetical protein
MASKWFHTLIEIKTERYFAMTEKEIEDAIEKIFLEKYPEPIRLPLDENGHIFIDKEKHPHLYDWAVNG